MKVYKWKKLNSLIAYSNPWIKVRKDSFELPSKQKTDFFVLERGEVVAILPLTNDNEVVLVEQYRPAVNDVTLDLPGGGVELDRGETPLEAAKRELAEETGYSAGEFISLGSFYPDSGKSEQIRHIFVARGLIPSDQKLGKTENIGVRKIHFERLIKMVRDGKLKETTLMLALLLHSCRYKL